MDAERFPVKQPHEQLNLNLPPPVELRPEPAGSTSAAVTVIAENVSKSFQAGGQVIQAVYEVSFTFTAGQFVAVLGPSGSGKSTLLYLLAGLDKPSAGELMIDGVDVRRLSA